MIEPVYAWHTDRSYGTSQVVGKDSFHLRLGEGLLRSGRGKTRNHLVKEDGQGVTILIFCSKVWMIAS